MSISMKPSETWINYYNSIKINKAPLRGKLNLYQIPVYWFLKEIIKKYNIKSILSAGCGQDIISLKLQRYFKNKLQITILDISEEVLFWNRRLFKRYHFDVNLIKSDIFEMPFNENSFDLVFNTGVLEHYTKEEQIIMTKEILRVIKPFGFFITANPSDNGRIYKIGMEAAKKKGIWPFGEENPIKSLAFLKEYIPEISDIKEYHEDFLSQLSFLPYVNTLYKLITIPILSSATLFYFVPRLFDFILSKKFGTYLVISIIRKK